MQRRAARVRHPHLLHRLNLLFHPGSCAPNRRTGFGASAGMKRCNGWARQEPRMPQSAGNWISITAPYASSSERIPSRKRSGVRGPASSILMPTTSINGSSKAAATSRSCGANCANEASQVSSTLCAAGCAAVAAIIRPRQTSCPAKLHLVSRSGRRFGTS